MDVSVLIPTYRRHEKLATCLRGLARQTFPRDRFEVLVGFDGPDSAGAEHARRAWRDGGGAADTLRVYELPKMGYQDVRNRLLAVARGAVMLSTNDDVRPSRRFVEVHAREQLSFMSSGRVVVISGASPWVVHTPDRFFDRLIRDTSMVFFMAGMDSTADPGKDWGFRHAWGLNMSCPMDCVRRTGGFVVLPGHYGYEDCELAHRMSWAFAAPVLFRPGALVRHDHRMSPEEYLAREYRLGYAALGLAAAAPRCAEAIFGRDIRARSELEYSMEYVARERTAASRAYPLLVASASMAASAAAERHWVDLAYQQHLPLKRWCWRRGLIDSALGLPTDPESAIREFTPGAVKFSDTVRVPR